MVNNNYSNNYGTQGYALSNYQGGPALSGSSQDPVEIYQSSTGALMMMDRVPTLAQVLDTKNSYSYVI